MFCPLKFYKNKEDSAVFLLNLGEQTTLRMNYHISACEATDIPTIFERYETAKAFQESKLTVTVWPDFSAAMVATEVAEKRQWKLVHEDTIICVWAIAFNDPNIWEERDADPSIYIHRIATHENYRGKELVKKIVDWAKPYAKSKNKTHIRLDTIGNNTRLIEYYQSAGFDFLGMFPITNPESLPAHYCTGDPACLFEIKLS